MNDKELIGTITLVLTDRYKVSQKRSFVSGQIPWIDGRPPQFIAWGCKLWKYTGMGVSSYFYHEIESFVQV